MLPRILCLGLLPFLLLVVGCDSRLEYAGEKIPSELQAASIVVEGKSAVLRLIYHNGEERILHGDFEKDFFGGAFTIENYGSPNGFKYDCTKHSETPPIFVCFKETDDLDFRAPEFLAFTKVR